MLFIDPRLGNRNGESLDIDREYIFPLSRLGIRAEPLTMEFGDVAFEGRGEGGASVVVGLELKKTEDLIRSLLHKKLAGVQLPGVYRDYAQRWLLTEGIWRENADNGYLEVMRNGWQPARAGNMFIKASDMRRHLMTLRFMFGAQYEHCPTRRDTIGFLADLYTWWTSKDLDQHKAHLQMYYNPPPLVQYQEPTLTQKIAALLEGIGWTKGKAVAEFFGFSVRRMACAPVQEWMKIDGIGKKIAESAVKQLEGPQ